MTSLDTPKMPLWVIAVVAIIAICCVVITFDRKVEVKIPVKDTLNAFYNHSEIKK